MTAKTSQPERKGSDRKGDRRGGRNERAPSEFSEATLSIDRVTRVVKGGRRMRFRAVVVVGNRKGKVGLGTGKATEVQAAVKKAIADAKRSMIRIPILNGTIPHQVEHKFKAARLRLIPAKEGTGIIAGGALRVILDHAGVKNVLSKRYGSRNKLVNAQATMQALELFRTTVKVEEEKEVKIEKDIGLKTETDDIRTGGVEITEMKKGDVEKSFTTKGDITGQDK